MKLEKVLEEFGLQKNKSKVYIASLQCGRARTEDIAKEADLQRTTTHEILQQLVKMGLMSFVTKGRTRWYSPERPEKLKILLEAKQRKLESILPELESLVQSSGTRPYVRFFEGVEGIKAVFEDTLTVKNKLLLGILSMEDLYEIPGKEYMDDYIHRRVKADIRLHVIRSRTKEVEETWSTSAYEMRELHYAPVGMVFPMTMYFYDKKVGIIGTKKENFGMIIESQDFFENMKNMFDVLWKITKTVRPDEN